MVIKAQLSIYIEHQKQHLGCNTRGTGKESRFLCLLSLQTPVLPAGRPHSPLYLSSLPPANILWCLPGKC